MAKNKRVALQLFTTLVKPLILTGTDFGVDICFGSGLAELKSSFFMKTGCHCLQLAWVVQLVVHLASKIPDFYGAFYCLNWILLHRTCLIAS